MTPSSPLPLAGLRVVEFTHMVMGPTCGMVLADMGAEVIKVEPIDGDRTRRLLGAGSGFFPMFNRNKKSIAIDLRNPQGAEVARKLAASADVVAENFKPGTMGKYGLDYASLAAANPRLIYVTHKGFLPGPYDHRTALDEVVQMMGGLAYMTGRPGDPLRAGTSVNDIMGGLFGAIGALGALIQRGITGKGMEVQSALFENNVFLMGQHMLQFAMTGKHPSPMPARDNPWAVYDVFTVRDGGQIFLAAVSDPQWQTFCDLLGFADLKADTSLATNNQRVRARPTLIPALRERLAQWSADELAERFEKRRTAVRTDSPARGSVRRRAPERHWRPRRHPAARRRPRGGDGADDAVSDHDAGAPARRAPRSAEDQRAHARIAARRRLCGRRDRCARRARCRRRERRRRKPPCSKERRLVTNDWNKRRSPHRLSQAARVRVFGFALVATLVTGSAGAQSDRPIKFILPVATASGVDTITRAATPALSKALGAPVIVENQAGAGGIVGTSALVKSAPDGTTLSIVSNNHVIYPSVYKSIPFDPVTDITPIAVVGTTPIVLVVNPKVPAKNVQELIALMKAKPDALNYASSGNGTILHLAAAMFLDQAGVKAKHIPYKGVGPMLTDLLGGQVDFATSSLPSVQQHIKSGALRALGVGAAEATCRSARRYRRWSSRECRTTSSKAGSPSSARRSCRRRTSSGSMRPSPRRSLRPT